MIGNLPSSISSYSARMKLKSPILVLARQHGAGALTKPPVCSVQSKIGLRVLRPIHLLLSKAYWTRSRPHVEVPNFLDPETLAEAVQADWPDPTNWAEALAQARTRFDRLLIGGHCDTCLSKETFGPHQSQRANQLFAVLQTLMEEMDGRGRLSTKGQRLRTTHFVGKTAWFSDESETNKQAPQRFTFPDPATPGGSLTCFWHGKIRSDALRMHFEWPPANPAGRLRIVYIGKHL